MVQHMLSIPLSRAALAPNEERYVVQSVRSGQGSGDGPFTKRVRALLEATLPAPAVLLTTSCTSALELSALLCRADAPADAPAVRPEVIVPSFTFVSTANAFLLHGWDVVFCDVNVDDGNIDAASVLAKLTDRTRAVVAVHYAGNPADVSAIGRAVDGAIAHGVDVAIIEDAAQAVFSARDGKVAGTLGDLGCFSFHGTKNFQCGEGGALVINRESLRARAEIVREKGTNRAQFLMGHVDKYTWVDVGGSFLSADTLAAQLLAQLEAREAFTVARSAVVARYHMLLAPLVQRGCLRILATPPNVESNHHLMAVVLNSFDERTRLMRHLNGAGIAAAFHYPALHRTPKGSTLHGDRGALPNSELLADRLLRLPLFVGLSDDDVAAVVDKVREFFA